MAPTTSTGSIPWCKGTARGPRGWCATPTTRAGLVSGVETFPLPYIVLPGPNGTSPRRPLRPSAVAQAHPLAEEPGGHLSGDVLFLDLDLIVTGNLGRVSSITSPAISVWRGIGRSRTQGSATLRSFRFPVGGHTYIYDRIMNECDRVMSRTFERADLYLPRDRRYEVLAG